MSVIDINKLSIAKPNTSMLKRSSSEPVLLVDQVSCRIDAGEILAIIGPNGAGKSTLLKAVAGDMPYQGEIHTPHLASQQGLRARQLAVLPQFSLLNFPYQVSEVVGLGRIPHDTGRKRDQEIIDEALAMMDISFLKHRLYPELSGGEKQRVQLARVLAQIWNKEDAQGDRLLLLDEPSTALDLGHQQDLMQAIKIFSQQGVAIMMVLHDINLATRYADKMLAMLCSQAIAYGNTEEVITHANIKKLFGVDAQIIKHPVHRSPVVLGL